MLWHTIAALGLSILLLSGCHRENDPTAPTALRVSPEQTQEQTRRVSFDLGAAGGLNIVGPYANVALPYVNAGYATARRRFPACLLTGWTVQIVSTLGAPPGTLCGTRPCSANQPIFGLTQPGPRRITLSLSMPGARAQSIINWETCNACRWVTTHQLLDRGCA